MGQKVHRAGCDQAAAMIEQEMLHRLCAAIGTLSRSHDEQPFINLVEDGVDINMQGRNGNTILHAVARPNYAYCWKPLCRHARD